jgi:hypothetical protein
MGKILYFSHLSDTFAGIRAVGEIRMTTDGLAVSPAFVARYAPQRN